MNTEVRRGFVPEDAVQFNQRNVLILRKAQDELFYLIERGYPIKSASTFIGNHYVLSERQRLAIVRATSDSMSLKLRKEKLNSDDLKNCTVNIDGLNLIITLEVALSGSVILKCMDETYRDLAGLRGTYRLIDKTDEAIRLIGLELSKQNIKKAVFYLDSPVSNTGRLKLRILELLNGMDYDIEVILTTNADVILEKQENVITSDSIILNKCISWINLLESLIPVLPEVNCIDLKKPLL